MYGAVGASGRHRRATSPVSLSVARIVYDGMVRETPAPLAPEA